MPGSARLALRTKAAPFAVLFLSRLLTFTALGVLYHGGASYAGNDDEISLIHLLAVLCVLLGHFPTLFPFEPSLSNSDWVFAGLSLFAAARGSLRMSLGLTACCISVFGLGARRVQCLAPPLLLTHRHFGCNFFSRPAPASFCRRRRLMPPSIERVAK